MRIIDDVAQLPSPGEGAFCVLADSPDGELAQRTAERLGLAHVERLRPLRRPAAIVADDATYLLVFVLQDQQRLTPVRISAAGDGALVVADGHALPLIRGALADAPDGLWPALIRLVISLAHASQDRIEEMIDASRRLEEESKGLSSARQRREMGGLRDRLFEIYEVHESLSGILAPEEELAQSLPEDERRLLARAARAFDTARSMSTQLYARLGDVLSQQSTIVSERLTIVATVFLPLSLATGFFGMNFRWLTEHTGSLTAFVVLGIVVPTALVLLTLALTRHITRSS